MLISIGWYFLGIINEYFFFKEGNKWDGWFVSCFYEIDKIYWLLDLGCMVVFWRMLYLLKYFLDFWYFIGDGGCC